MIFSTLKSQSFRIADSYVHLSLADFSLLSEQKSLSSVNLSLFLHDVSLLWVEPDTSLSFAQFWETNLEGARTLFQNWHL